MKSFWMYQPEPGTVGGCLLAAHRTPRVWLCRVVLVAATIIGAHSFMAAQDSRYSPKDQQIPPPSCLTMKGAWEGGSPACTETTHREWLDDITHWRNERRIRIGYDPARYELPALRWAQSSFIQPQMMVHDRFFYDPAAGRYTVDRYLDDLEKRYGGIDAVLIWATYPNMGIDSRNQLDMVRAMPGGVAGARRMVADFHKRHVRVLFPLMMWDQGTAEPASAWPRAVAELMKEVGADGVNGDTQDGVPLAFSLAAEQIDHPLVFEPELTPADEAIAWNVLTWGQYKFGFVPTVDRFRWLEPRHQVNIQGRWNRDKTDDLQYAFFNGEGWESWENVWGIWNGVTPRDGEATRRMAAIERAVAPFLNSPGWEPFSITRRYGVFASRWPLNEETVWTIVNRNEYDVTGRQISVPAKAGMRYYDLYHGVEVQPQHEPGEDVLSFALEAHGYGAILAAPSGPSPEIQALMARMKTTTSTPLRSFSNEWKPLPQTIVDVPEANARLDSQAEMVRMPAADFLFKVEGVELEGMDDVGVDVQYPWEDTARRFHEHRLSIRSFLIDKYPVTNGQFKAFLEATKYSPRDNANFLKDWKNGSYPEGWKNKPVTWVSLEDARAYAHWAGKRLPHEWEWQYAAQGLDERLYPWGNAWDAGAVPTPEKGRVKPVPDDVDAHPSGASPLGVMDLVGNVWQWTDEFADEHTRAAILRGGSKYQPQGSLWYFPQAYKNSQHGKLLLMAPSYDRSGMLGFRCASDSE